MGGFEGVYAPLSLVRFRVGLLLGFADLEVFVVEAFRLLLLFVFFLLLPPLLLLLVGVLVFFFEAMVAPFC